MLTIARRVSSDRRICWQQADAEQLPFRGSTFDVILCQQGLQSISRKESALARMHRVLVPNGYIGISVWSSVEHNPGFALLRQVLSEAAGVPTSGFNVDPFSLSSPSLLELLLLEAGFGDVVVKERTLATTFQSIERFAVIFLNSPAVQVIWARPGGRESYRESYAHLTSLY